MKPDDESRAWMVIGALGSMALGVALIPLRGVTSASNLAFVFVAFIIVVAELGGRSAALVTAVVSAMSLNFFLTEPYLTLAITKRDDVIAFFAMAACGSIAAAFGKRRARWSDVAERAETGLQILQRMAHQSVTHAPLGEILAGIARGFRLGTIVLRDAHGTILASAPPNAMSGLEADTPLVPETLLAENETRVRFGRRGLRLPPGGGRITVRTASAPVTLDLWEGDERGFNVDETRALATAVSVLALDVSRRQEKSIDR